MPAEHGPRPKTPDADSPGGTATAGEAGGEQTLELWSWLPRLSPRQARLEEWLARWMGAEALPHWLDWIRGGLKQTPEIGRPEIVWGASGLGRPGLIAQLRWPRLNTRLALGLEVPLAHAVVDHLLGYDRPFAESRLQLTPVEWGVWTYLVVRSLEEFERVSQGDPGHGTIAAPADLSRLVLDRVGPDPFDPAGLGAVVTLRSSIRVGSTTGTARLWLPAPALNVLLASEPQSGTMVPDLATSKAREFSSLWRALAGLVAMPNGLKRLRTGGSAGLPGSCLLLPAGSRLPRRSRLPGLTLRPPRHSTRQQLPYTLRCERFAFGCLIARGIKLLGHAVRRPALRLPRLDELEHRRGIGQLSPGQHRPRDAMFRHRPEAPVQMDPHFLARRRCGRKQGRR
ncbi:MAG: hypothetical protein WBX00_07430 [Isosphaeraceae bacterium]